VGKKIFAAIDIGTNTFRLLIAEVRFNALKNTHSIREIQSARVITRLGQGISQNRCIQEDSMKRCISVLKQFSDTIAHHNVLKTVAVATSALRDAENRNEFLEKAREAAGLNVEIISGDEEAQKSASGMLIGISVPERSLMVDIGGGSTELIFSLRGKPLVLRSLNLGVVYLADQYMKNDPPSQKDMEHMARIISEKFMPKLKYFTIHLNSNTQLIGTAGTVTTLAAISQKLTRFSHNKIHNIRLKRETIKNIFSRIAFIPARERAQYIPFEPARLDIIVPGTLILLMLMEAFNFTEVLVSNYGLREGILLDLYEKTNGKT
jgi:exopolyphosphatase/guanosine-5'-triphosphate,3'-diphosphate pyrophosphatase